MFLIQKKVGETLVNIKGRPLKRKKSVYKTVDKVRTIDEARKIIEVSSKLSIKYDRLEVGRENIGQENLV